GERLLLVAGGCGLAPLAGLIDAADGELQLIYAARNRAYQVLARERARWRGRLRLVETLDQGDDGLPQGSPLEALAWALDEAQVPTKVLCCGPEPLMLAGGAAPLYRPGPGGEPDLAVAGAAHALRGGAVRALLHRQQLCLPRRADLSLR
ncbi:oxidoreductase FAD/NAD(P)-binding:oxidoreductase FAD-binding region, partial [Stutzerimonas degradans]